MLQVANHTPFTAQLSVFPDPAGVETAYMIVKASFAIGAAGLEVLKPQLPLLPADVFWGDPVSSSLRAAGEFGLLKPATDVLLVGRAIAPEPGTRVADVGLRVGPVSRVVRVFGDRHWKKSAGSWRPSEPLAWERMPLRWELAYGGIAPASGNEMPEHEPRNPVGRGLVSRKGRPLDEQPLPNLEDPLAPLNEPEDRPPPACFAPIAPTWMPRRQYAGTYDEAWTRSRAPYLPRDFDARFFNVAPPGLVAAGHLQGGEPARLIGVSADGPIDFVLPACGLDLEFDFDGGRQPRQPQLETVLIEPDAARVQLLFRAALAVDKKVTRLQQVRVRSSTFERDGRPSAPLRGLGNLPPSYAAAA